MGVPLSRVFRGGEIESVHSGSIAVVDSRGRLLAFAGDPAFHASLRSAGKPFQAIPLLEYGGADEYELSGEEIALTCASHGGEPHHVTTAAALLRKGEFDETDLLCGAHEPYDEKAAAELRAAGEAPSALHNNCSGKHAGMLLASQVMDVASARYIDPLHPVQELCRSTLADFAGVDPESIRFGVDGCGVPAFFLNLHRVAFAYARLMASSEGAEAPGALARYASSASTIVASMTGFPSYVAGAWSMTTPLMEAFSGELLAKEGAEGLYAMAVSPALAGELIATLGVSEELSVGIAIKLDDGAARGRGPAILRTLDLLGLSPFTRGELVRYRDWPLHNVAGARVGEVVADFELEVI